MDAGFRQRVERWRPIAGQIELAPVDESTCAGCAPSESASSVFPQDVLPPPVRAYVHVAAESLNVPAEMVACPLLTMAGGMIGNRLHLVLKSSWREYPVLFLAVVAEPGSAKTPALRLAQRPLDALQRAAHEVYLREQAEYEDALAAWKAGGQEDGEPKPEPPRLRHYFTSDPTVEALAGMLAGTPGVALVRDEISGWVGGMNQYKGGAGADRQAYLSLWSSAALKVDRVGRDPVYVPAPVVSVVGTIQPDLAGVLHDAARRRDGLAERILPSVPDVAPARWTDAEPSAGQYQDVLAVFRALDELPRANLDGDDPPGIGVTLTAEARALWIAWHDENATLIAGAEGLASGFYSKLPAHTARLALILHALWNSDDPGQSLSGERMADAIELAEFFRAQIGRFLTLLAASAPVGSAGVDGRIMRILRSADDGDGWVTRSDLLRRLGNIKAAALNAALGRFLEEGTVERRTVATDTRPAEEWRVTRHANDSHGSKNWKIPSASSAPLQEGSKSSNPSKRVRDRDDPISGSNGAGWEQAHRVVLA